jgi:molybdopterin converting factor small subunit
MPTWRVAVVKLILASPIAVATGGTREIDVDFEGTLKGLFDLVASRYGTQFYARVLQDDGALRRFVNAYVNGEDVRFLAGLETRIPRDATVDLLPAVSGG